MTVIPAMTDAGLPGDLIAHLLAERLGPVEQIVCAHLITGTGEPPSRGSLRSLQAIQESFASGGLSYLDGEWRPGIPQVPRRRPLRRLRRRLGHPRAGDRR